MKVKLISQFELSDLEVRIAKFLAEPCGTRETRTGGTGLSGLGGRVLARETLFPRPLTVTVSYANQQFVAAITYKEEPAR